MQMSRVFVHLIELQAAQLDKYRMGFLVDTLVVTISISSAIRVPAS